MPASFVIAFSARTVIGKTLKLFHPLRHLNNKHIISSLEKFDPDKLDFSKVL
jgi:hypothetical protein